MPALNTSGNKVVKFIAFLKEPDFLPGCREESHKDAENMKTGQTLLEMKQSGQLVETSALILHDMVDN